MHVTSSYHGNRATNKHTNIHTAPITIHCAAKLSVQCNENPSQDNIYKIHLLVNDCFLLNILYLKKSIFYLIFYNLKKPKPIFIIFVMQYPDNSSF